MIWPEHSLDELGFVSRGKSKHRPRNAEHLYDGLYPFVQTGDIKHSGLYLTEYTQTYSEDGLAQSKLWPEGTLCITIAANIADTSILGIDACFPDSVIGFIPNKKKADARFVKYMFDAHLKVKFQQFTQGAAQDNLSQMKLLSLRFPVPDIFIQQQIADVLSGYDDLIENNRRRIQLLEESARLLYKEWFVNFHFPGYENTKIVDGIPEGWERKPLGTFASVKSGFAFKSKDWTEDGYPVIKIKNIIGDNTVEIMPTQCVDETAVEKANQFLLSEGDFLIAMTGATVGKVGIVPKLSNSVYLNQRVGVFRYYGNEDLTPFLLPFFNSELGHSSVVNFAGGAAQPNISGGQIESIPLLFPKYSVLKRYLDCMKAGFKQRLILYEQNQKLAEARDLLLPRLMNGEIEV